MMRSASTIFQLSKILNPIVVCVYHSLLVAYIEMVFTCLVFPALVEVLLLVDVKSSHVSHLLSLDLSDYLFNGCDNMRIPAHSM